MLVGVGSEDTCLQANDILQVLKKTFEHQEIEDKRVLIIIPDKTRTAPIPLFFRLFHELLSPVTRKLDYLVALGTHQPLSDSDLCQLVGVSPQERTTEFKDVGIYNHLWADPETFVTLGTISKSEIQTVVGESIRNLPHDAGLLRDVPVTLNKMVLDYDLLVICGPTFPHEVAGFSGGNKYFFPGIGGPEVINYSHWLGAVISSYKVIGTVDTPVRRIIDRAASMIDVKKLCCSLVVKGEGVAGLYTGSPEEAFKEAASLSSKLHVRRLKKPAKRVLSIMPEMYDDIWTAAKGMYKLEPVIEDGGEVIIYAPHISEISYSHGQLLDEIGYHTCEFFVKQWDKYKDYPGGVLAHSTHVRGLGSYDSETGIETPRVNVTLATQIPPERCANLGLGYINPEEIDPDTWEAGGEGFRKVPKAGEILYRLNEG
ncbi:MAG TPA: lactate racemase domain-containing protein [Acidobacteriota bacterium]|nr:lactate racemase domain-containing protein [Acidobacteriota bacterium]